MNRLLFGYTAIVLFFAFFVQCMFGTVLIKRKKKNHGLCFVAGFIAMALSYFYFMIIRLYDKERTIPSFFDVFINQAVAITLIVLSIIGSIVSGIVLLKKGKDKITNQDIYEGINNLNLGICYFRNDGLTIMVNEKMDQLSFALTGRYLYDGNSFLMDILKNSKDNKLMIEDRYYSYFFSKVTIDNNEVNEIILYDITKEVELSKELEEEYSKRKDYREKLKAYSKDMKELIKEEEILATKVNVHTEFGNLLLLGKYSLKNIEERRKFLDKAYKISELALHKQSDVNPLVELKEIAHMIGINLIVKGKVKTNHYEVVSRLIHECITNAYKHAHGKNVYLDVVSKDGYIYYSCYNDGDKPNESVHEGGGLSSIRLITEKNNGEMKLSYTNGFKIILVFKEED